MGHSGPVRVWRRMATLTRERLIVRRNQVAVRTDRAIVRNAEPGVIEGRAQPTRGDPRSVAGQASGRVQRGNVVRNSAAERHGALPSGLVAAIAIRVRDSKSERGGTHVARGAGGGYVRTLQGPARRAVIELASRPEHRVVAGRALRGREARRDVIRYRSTERLRAQPGGLVTAVAIRVRYREGVVVAHVAVGAGHDFTGRRHLVRTRQRPARGAVVEGCGSPGDGAVARRAVGRGKRGASCGVRRVVSGLPSCQMASGVAAVGRRNRQRVVIVDVARRAGRSFPRRRHLVRIRQRETRGRVVEG